MNPKSIKTLTVVLMMFTVMVFLNGCQTGEFIASQEMQKQDQEIQRIKDNKERKKEGLAPIPAPNYAPVELNPIAMLSVDQPEGDPVEFFTNTNLKEVFNGATSPTIPFKQSYFLTRVATYHWNKGKGVPAGTIALQDDKGKTYGPWPAVLEGGVYWAAHPSMTLPAGTYTLIDSGSDTWAQNADSGGLGLTWVSGIPVK